MIAITTLASLTVSVSASETSALLPYIQTTVLVPGSSSGPTNGTAYVFTPNDAGDSIDLLSVDVSSTLASSSISNTATTLTSGLPFLSSGTNTTTFIPTLAADGSIIVYAGDCTSDSTSSLWIYNTTSASPASWKQQHVTSSSALGPHFLGGGVAFSEVIAPTLSTPQIYSYGGLCPNASLAGTTWIEAAEYTNAMVQLTQSTDGYEAETLSLKSPPIAEAGFSLTPMRPSTSNISGTISQGINSVVLGGHTQSAFVNMSTAAVWTLPQESWSFVSISGPSTSSSSDTSELTKNRDENVEVQSRSGHTAVLNEAGTALVILGGWVGNTSQAAEPQVVVLEMDTSDFGEWTWTVPSDQPLTGGEGIYGHGAALLPGNVMMVAGGYSISSSSSSSRLRSRDDIGVAGGQLQMFLNLTSMSWTDSYTNPSSASTGTGQSTAPPSNARTLGLGLGLGLGIPFLLAFIALILFCIRHRRRHRHSVRDDLVRNLTSGAAFITSDEMLGVEHENDYPWGPQAPARWYSYPGGHDPYLSEEKSLGYESLRGQRGAQPRGGFDDLSPVENTSVRGSMRRKPGPRVAKGLYQPTGVDESRAMGVISPILEDEEDELSMHGAMSPDHEMEGNEDDPFVTPSEMLPTSLGGGVRPGPDERSTILLVAPSPSPSPSSPTTVEERTPTRAPPPPIIVPQHPEVQDWVSDVDASEGLITRRLQPRSMTLRNSGLGQTSPTRRGSARAADGELSPGARTDSNLSESNRSAFSFMPSRADSLRVGKSAGVAVLSPGYPEKRGGTSHSDQSSSSGNTNGSYTTAKSIPVLQQEGPGLLQLGRPRAISCIENVVDESEDDPFAGPGSPSKNKAPRRSWFGSLRRVFSGGHSSGSSVGGSSRNTDSPAHGESSDYDRLGLGGLGLGGVGLLQKRQGRSAWDERGSAAASAGGGLGQGYAGEGWDEDDWDIEKAVEQRLVQVMFSVPKERLRVVNGEPDIISIEESVVVVDPEKEGSNDQLEEALSPVPEGEDEGERLLDKGKGRAEEEQISADQELAETPATAEPREDEAVGQALSAAQDQGKQQPERRRLLLQVPRSSMESEMTESPGRRSFSPGVPMRAEEVRFERPRTRVLEMVEGIEERSRSNSPTKSKSSLTSLRDI